LIVFLLAFFPNIRHLATAEEAGVSFGKAWWRSCLVGSAIDTASLARYAPSNAWCSSLAWLKENTPEPFGNPEFYYQRHELPPPGDSYNYPESAYGVLAWWDYGYWITRMAHRIPNANPSQDPRALTTVASFFTSQDEESASEIAQELGSSYIVVDHETTLGKFWAIVTWVGKEQSEFFDIYYIQQEDRLVPRQLLRPEYYRSLAVRLYNFDGKAVTPENVVVISYDEVMTPQGQLLKRITTAEQFDNYEEAEAYLQGQESDNYRIVGTNPFISPVPLEALEHYRLTHSSDESINYPEVGMVPGVKIFEYVKEGR